MALVRNKIVKLGQSGFGIRKGCR